MFSFFVYKIYINKPKPIYNIRQGTSIQVLFHGDKQNKTAEIKYDCEECIDILVASTLPNKAREKLQ